MSKHKPDPARLRGMASDPRNVLDMHTLLVAAEYVEQREEMASLLRELEWAGADEGGSLGFCPVCQAYKLPHAPDCKLASLLAKIGEEP
jgi:hypothetical protein